ncbi:MAG TPA: histidine kinase [Candidatus Eisenbergiella merdavium]|uniref:Histidine kinase n=1 Tax=Candidatus Eisenbergiella merdavium TaxID=2838551 RepID=A0A9D2NC44_9FIRM|nr:histidine kinase [Candidatus Eisenbergiella merdavium]
MKRAPSHKQWYLSRLIFFAALFGYSVVVLLLIVLNGFLIMNCQQHFVQVQQELVQDELHQVSNSLDILRTTVYEYWYEDENFARLGEYNQEKNMLSYRYELMEELSQRMSYGHHISGFFVFYTGREICAYVVDGSQILSEETGRLKDLLTAYHTANTPASRSFFFLSPDGRCNYAVIGYTKGNATLYGVYNMDTALSKIKAVLPEGTQILVSEEADAFGWNGSERESEALRMALKNTNLPFSYRKGLTLILGEKAGDSGIKVAVQIPLTFRAFFNVQIAAGFFLLAVSVLIFVMLFRFLRRQLLYPLRELNQTMEDIRRGGRYHFEEKRYSLRELDEINQTFDYMMKALEQQKMVAYEEALEKQKARIQYLQLQIKPHFYLNGLKTVNALAMLHDVNRLQEYLQRLSVHMRYMLSLEQEEVRLEKELLFTSNYVDLQREMTGRKIEYSVCQEGVIPDVLVPVLSVQTFVENSIKYAKLGNTDSALKISVEIFQLELEGTCWLDIIIRDNGPGYPEAVLSQIKSGFMPDGENVGINNIRRRCSFLYGESASFLFENRNGAKSEMIIPARRGSHECIAGR